MSIVIILVLLAVFIFVVAREYLPIKLAPIGLLAIVIFACLFASLPTVVGIVIAIPVIIAAVLFNFSGLRKSIFTKPMLRYVTKQLPPISQTEQEAIDAGTVWWEAELFQGNPQWSKLFKVQQARLTDEEQSYLDGPVEEFCQLLDDWQITHELNDLPDNAWQFIKEHKLFGLIIPKEYGGLGFSALANSEIVMKIASRSGSAGVTVMVPNSLGPGELLLEHGTEEQRQYYLPRLASGEEIPCFALTGPWAGSDAGAMMDAGVLTERFVDGKRQLGFVTSWEKRYITLAPVATVIGLAFKAYDPDKLLGDTHDLGITCALLPANLEGIKIGQRHMPLNAAFMNGPIEGEDVFIPMEYVIGDVAGVGRGWKMLMESLAAGRAISLPASGVSMSKVAAYSSGAYANVREQFNIPIGKFEAIEEVLGRIGGMTYMMDATRLFTLAGIMEGEKPSVVSAIAKLHLTDGARQVINDAMDIHGGKGIIMGPKNYLARAYQQTPIAITVEGANILTRSLIVFGQGAMRCHPYLLKHIEHASAYTEKPDEKGLSLYDDNLMKHIQYIGANKARAILYGLTRGLAVPLSKEAKPAIYFRHLARISAGFALVTDVTLLMLGGAFKRKEQISARFADTLSYMFMCSAVLKRYKDLGYPKEDKILVDWTCQFALCKAEMALYEILKNFPNKWVGKLLRTLVFPWGRILAMPNDDLDSKVAHLLQTPGEIRDRICEGIFIGRDEKDALFQLNAALDLSLESRDLRKRLRDEGHECPAYMSHKKWLTELLEKDVIIDSEHDLLEKAYKVIKDVIMVDSFEKSSVTPKFS